MSSLQQIKGCIDGVIYNTSQKPTQKKNELQPDSLNYFNSSARMVRNDLACVGRCAVLVLAWLASAVIPPTAAHNTTRVDIGCTNCNHNDAAAGQDGGMVGGTNVEPTIGFEFNGGKTLLQLMMIVKDESSSIEVRLRRHVLPP